MTETQTTQDETQKEKPVSSSRKKDTHKIILSITENAAIAALYFVVTSFVPAISFTMFQARIGEVLVLLAFWRPDFIIGLTLGCFFANFYGAMMGFTLPWDMLIGTGATLIAVLFVSYLSPKLWVAAIWPPLFNGVIVGWELYYVMNIREVAMWVQMGWVCLGELAVMVVGYFLWFGLFKAKWFRKMLAPTRHVEVGY